MLKWSENVVVAKWIVYPRIGIARNTKGLIPVLTKPLIAIPTEVEAIATANRWLHREIGLALHTTTATFDTVSYYWHLPVKLAYPDKGTLGVIGDLYLQAVTGAFAGELEPNEFRQRADALAALYGVE